MRRQSQHKGASREPVRNCHLRATGDRQAPSEPGVEQAVLNVLECEHSLQVSAQFGAGSVVRPLIEPMALVRVPLYFRLAVQRHAKAQSRHQHRVRDAKSGVFGKPVEKGNVGMALNPHAPIREQVKRAASRLENSRDLGDERIEIGDVLDDLVRDYTVEARILEGDAVGVHALDIRACRRWHFIPGFRGFHVSLAAERCETLRPHSRNDLAGAAPVVQNTTTRADLTRGPLCTELIVVHARLAYWTRVETTTRELSSSMTDLPRDIGGFEARMDELEKHFGRVEGKMDKGFSDIKGRLDALAAAESRRKGALGFIRMLASSGVITGTYTNDPNGHPVTPSQSKPAQAQPAMQGPLLDLKPQCRPLAAEIQTVIEKVCASQGFILGPAVKELEASVAAYSQCKYGIGVCPRPPSQFLLPRSLWVAI